VGQVLLVTDASRSHSDTPHTAGLIWMSDQPDSEIATWQHTQHSQQTDIHVPAGTRTPNPCKRAAADPGRRPRGYGVRLRCDVCTEKIRGEVFIFARNLL